MSGAVVPTINTFDGGEDGEYITANNSGLSGDAFGTVSAGSTSGTDATVHFDDAHAAHGALSAKIATGATAASPFLAWNWNRLAKLETSYSRFYLYMTGAPAANHRLFNTLAAGVGRAGLTIATTGKLRAVNGAGSTIFESTNAIPFNQWIRVEYKIVGHASTGQVELRYYAHDSTTPIFSQASSADLNLGGYVDTWRFGVTASTSNVAPFWMDAVGVGADDWLGVYDPFAHLIIDRCVLSDTRPDEPGIPDTSVLFDSAQYVEVPDHADFSPATTNEFTVACLVRPDSLWMTEAEGGPDQRDYVHYMGKGETFYPWEDGDLEWGLRMYQQGNSENRSNRFSMYAWNPHSPAPGETNLGNGSYFQDIITPGDWTLVTGVIDPTYVKIYRDGVKRDEDLLDQGHVPNWGVVIDPQDRGAPFRIGTRGNASYFQGSIARVAVFNRALTDAEIAGLQTARLAGTYDTYVTTGDVGDALVAFYKLNEETGSTTAVDYSGNNHHGSYVKAVTSEINGFIAPETENTVVARFVYGDQIQDYVIGVGTGNTAVLVGGATVTFWTARTGGTQYTDLLTIGGSPISEVTSSDGTDGRAVGSIPAFQGPPADVAVMWAQADAGSGPGPRQAITGRAA